MGRTRWDAAAWMTRSTAYVGKSADAIYTSAAPDAKMVPNTIDFREARDSVHNPASTPIILALDCTGSMNAVLEVAVKKFGVVIQELIDRKPVTDPAIMTMVFDDVEYVRGASGVLQVSQFESDDKAVDQLEKMHLTRMGGGNQSESYHLPLYMAAFKTKTDAFEKRNEKGYLFVVGDEQVPEKLTKAQIQDVFGPDEYVEGDGFTYDELYAAASRMYNVFHVVVMQGSHAHSRGEAKMREVWSKHVGQNLIILDDIASLPEVIVSTIQVHRGADADSVAASWSGTTAVVVKKATTGLTAPAAPGGGVVKL